MDSADDRLDEKESGGLTLTARILSFTSGESNWSRNYGWQLLSFTSLILGVGFYFIFVNSPIKAVRLMPSIPKTYGTYSSPMQIAPVPDDDNTKATSQTEGGDKKESPTEDNETAPANAKAPQ
ncbi:MAG: hypothetical protein RLY14_2810 [Planctomycetota bacterium]|jgi:hypothetical protein